MREDRSAASSAPPIVGVIRTIAIERQCGMELFFASSSSSRMAPNNFFSFSLAATFAAATFAAAAAPRHRPATAAATLAVVSISSLLECSWCCVLLHPPPQHPLPSFSFFSVHLHRVLFCVTVTTALHRRRHIFALFLLVRFIRFECLLARVYTLIV